MNSLLKWLLLSVLLLTIVQVEAQVSGYLGKRTIVGMEMSAFPNVWQYVQGERPIRLHWQAGLQVERIVSRRISAGASWHFFSTPLAYSSDSLSGTIALQGSHVGLDFRTYPYKRQGNLPPIGTFHRAGVSFLHYRLVDNAQAYDPAKGRNLASYQGLLLTYTLGHQWVWADQFTTNVGVRMSWTAAFSPSTFPYQDQVLWERSFGRIRAFFGAQIVVGAGYLLPVRQDQRPVSH